MSIIKNTNTSYTTYFKLRIRKKNHIREKLSCSWEKLTTIVTGVHGNFAL